MIKYLDKQGADVNSKNNNGATVLRVAVTKGLLEMVKYLVEHGTNMNKKDTTDGWTVLRYAVCFSSLGMVKYLVKLALT